MSVRLPLFDHFAGVYDWLTGHAVWREATDALLRQAEMDPPPTRVLDIGCGPGVSTFSLAAALPDAELLLGVDLAPAMIARARNWQRSEPPHPGLRFAVGDASALDLPDGDFDLVTGHSFLYLVPDRVAVLRELARVLRPGGRLVLLEPRRRGALWSAAPAALGHLGRLRREPVASVRFGISMVAWRVASSAAGQLDEPTLRGWLEQAGLRPIRFAPTLGGLGLHVVAERPA